MDNKVFQKKTATREPAFYQKINVRPLPLLHTLSYRQHILGVSPHNAQLYPTVLAAGQEPQPRGKSINN